MYFNIVQLLYRVTRLITISTRFEQTSEIQYNKAYKEGAWDWLYSRLETCIKKGSIDASDAGMVVYMLTGIEKTDPRMVKEIMENPIMK